MTIVIELQQLGMDGQAGPVGRGRCPLVDCRTHPARGEDPVPGLTQSRIIRPISTRMFKGGDCLLEGDESMQLLCSQQQDHADSLPTGSSA
ncbi:hypothetical protein [Nocardioides sp. LHG3406-4]|uniref:hypothetical protein n=1 Tax=Nocardioides sp. LHG3406-4 TaxID=2804575 RepID=UPI003CF06413